MTSNFLCHLVEQALLVVQVFMWDEAGTSLGQVGSVTPCTGTCS